MPTLTVRNLDEDLIRRLRIRAAEHGIALGGEQPSTRRQAAERLAAFRRRTDGRGSSASAELLEESRSGRMDDLARKPAGA